MSLAKQLLIDLEKFPNSDQELDLLRTKINMGLLIRAQDPASHINVMLAVYNNKKQILAGLHKRAQLWIPNGGHIELGETMAEAVVREAEEEIGLKLNPQEIGAPKILTIVPIEYSGRACRRHYDLWHFLPVANDFQPDNTKMLSEFEEYAWLTVSEIKAKGTSQWYEPAYDYFEANY